MGNEYRLVVVTLRAGQWVCELRFWDQPPDESRGLCDLGDTTEPLCALVSHLGNGDETTLHLLPLFALCLTLGRADHGVLCFRRF